MKTYLVFVDYFASIGVEVEACNESEARDIAIEKSSDHEWINSASENLRFFGISHIEENSQ